MPAAKSLHGRQAEQDAERPVVLAGIRDRVQMRSNHEHRQLRPQSRVASDQVAGRVGANGQIGLFHPLDQLAMKAAHGLAEEPARDLALFLRKQGDLIAASEHNVGHPRPSRARASFLSSRNHCTFFRHLSGRDATFPHRFPRTFTAPPLRLLDHDHG